MWNNWKPSLPRVDVPVFTRCCFCIPLRHGLLAWGYVKLVILSLTAVEMIMLMRQWVDSNSLEVLPVVISTILCIDIIFNFIFIIAGHLKHKQLYQVYYYYSLGLLCAYVIVLIWYIIKAWFGFPSIFFHFIIWVALTVYLEFATIYLVQVYVTMLVRTEVRKLGNNSNFEFVNSTSEATCSMDLGSTVPDTNFTVVP